MKLLGETKDAASEYDAMTVHERHELNAYFQPHVMEFFRLAEELKRAGHMPTFEASRLLGADWDYLQTPSRSDAEVVVRYLGSLKWDRGES